MENLLRIFCQGNMALWWLLMTYCSIHRGVTLSALIRNTEDRINIETHKWIMWREWGTLEYSVLNKMSSQTSPLKSRQKRKQDGRWLKGNSVLQSQWDWCTCELPQRMCSTHNTCTDSSKQNPRTEMGKWTWNSSPNEDAIYNWYLLVFTIVSFLKNMQYKLVSSSSAIHSDLIGKQILTWECSIY